MTIKLRSFFKLFFLFGLTQLVGLYAAYRFLPELGQTKPSRLSDFSIYDLIIIAVFFIALIFIIRKFKTFSSVFFKIFLTLIALVGIQAIVGLWFGSISSVLITILLLVLFWGYNNVFLQDLVMLLTFAGVGSILGLSLTPETVVVFLVILSFYDILAVYKTRHMVQLAESMIQSRAIFGFVVPNSFSGIKAGITQVSPGEQFMILGSGDVILPLLLSASLIRISLLASVVVALFSVLGLFLMHLIFVNQKVRRPMAALPPIAALSMLGYLLVLVF